MAIRGSDVIGEQAGAVGVGFRAAFAQDLLCAEATAVGFVEVAPENYMGVGGQRGRRLAAARERWPIVSHGLCGDFAGAAAFDEDFFSGIRAFLKHTHARWYSDHLCYTHVDGAEVHDLLPLPYCEEAIERVVARLGLVRDRLEMPIAVENISAYVRAPTTPGEGAIDEPMFVRRVVEEADALMLLDLNNVYVNAVNFGFDPDAYIAQLPLERVVQIHVAGHEVHESDSRGLPMLLIDTHGEAIAAPVYALLRRTLERCKTQGLPFPPVLLERDHNIPPLHALEAEVRQLRDIVAAVHAGHRGVP
jgi:uncharacterized protein (UPF0276 family)